MSYRKKLIEVALPLSAINEGSKPETENPFLKGHPRAIHNWWARTPLSVSRAILFAQLIDDPGDGLPPNEARKSRERLLDFVARLATWEATTDEKILGQAREMIRAEFKGEVPEFWDMFAGRASIPLEAQRLGLKVTSSDLNPVAVTIQRALLEFPPRFKDRPPVHPDDGRSLLKHSNWKGTSGLAADIRWYGEWVRQRAAEKLERLYPRGPKGEQVLAWLWARMVPSPNPACEGAHVPLVRSFSIATRPPHLVWVEPKVRKKAKSIEFIVRTGESGPSVTGTVGRKGGTCLISKVPMPLAHIREQAKQGKMTYQLMAMVAGSNGRRVYLDPDEAHARVADSCRPSWKPDCEMPKKHRNFQPPVYGMDNLGDLFTPRQLVALTTIGAIIEEAHAKITQDTSGDRPYADAIVTYLSCALSRMTDYHSNLTTWNPTNANVRCLFQRQAIPMAWDFCEANPIHGKLSFAVAADWVASAIGSVAVDGGAARVTQLDARKARPTFASQPVISTDPPYYDNISYADLADFFYVWLRFTLKRIDPQTFATLLTPKEPELIASPTRHGSMERAQEHFRNGFRHVFRSLLESGHPSTPITIYYAFKQHEDDDERGGDGHRASSGWETMLEGLSESGFQITGTWPVRTTKKARAVALGANALASAVVLVVRRRHESAPMATRKEFVAELKKELPSAIGSLTQASIAPVDLAQASIGPGMAVFTRYAKVLEAEGTPMSVRTALQIINQELDAYLVAQEGEMDRDTRFCLAWFEQHGMNEGAFGEADVLARAKNTSVQGLVDGGVLKARAGKVRVLRRTEYQKDWDPAQDGRLTVWECAQHLILQLNTKGEEGAAQLCRRLGGGRSEDARALAYRLYSICERKGRSEEALAYNSLVVSWPAIQERAAQLAKTSRQSELFQ